MKRRQEAELFRNSKISMRIPNALQRKDLASSSSFCENSRTNDNNVAKSSVDNSDFDITSAPPRASSPIDDTRLDSFNNKLPDDLDDVSEINPFPHCEEVDWPDQDDNMVQLESDLPDNDNSRSTSQETSELLYPGSDCTVKEFCCILLSLQRKHGLSDSSINDWCKLLRNILPSPNNCPTSFKALNSKINSCIHSEIGNICSDVKKICVTCCSILKETACVKCTRIGRPQKPAYFFNCSIKEQLLLITKEYGTVILDYLKKATETRKLGDRVTDIVTGKLYSKLYPCNPKENELTLNLLLNADGARFTKSKAGSFWPVLAEVVELPRKVRSKFTNVLLLGVWQGETKPIWNKLLNSTWKELIVTDKLGFRATINENRFNITIKVIGTVFDLPARASIWHALQYNGKLTWLHSIRIISNSSLLSGKCGCMECFLESLWFDNRRIWPYEKDLQLKTSDWYAETVADIQAGKLDAPVCGVKGPSVLSSIGVDPCTQNPLDFMHIVYEGILDRILSAIFGMSKIVLV